MTANSYFIITGLEKMLGAFHFGPISLELADGDYMILLGPTGSGKTSLLRGIAGTLGKTKGEIVLDGSSIGDLLTHKRRLGYVSQTGDLFPHLSVSQNVGFGTRYANLARTDAKRRVARFLELFSLAHLADRYPAMLSGGEVKRAAMARSLITKPRLLLLDEPLAMLDDNGSREVLKTLRVIHDELRTTTIHVTHDRHEAWSIAQSCAVMNEGTILQKGSVEEVFRKPGSRFVAEFLGGRNIFRASFQDGKAVVGWGEIPLADIPATKEGWVMIRPESISPGRSGDKAMVSGMVEEVRDFGEYIEVKVKVGLDVIVLRSSVEQSKCIKAGMAVSLRWAEEAAHAIADD